MQAEFDEGFETLGANAMIAYKFFSLFRAKGTEISYGKLFTHKSVDPEIVDDIRAWLKAQKEWLRTRPAKREIELRMWWLVQKVTELGLFDALGQRHILFWYDSCTEALA